MLTVSDREHDLKKPPSPSQREVRAVLNEDYGLGESGMMGTPLLGLGESGMMGTPLFGFGESGIMGTPLFGFGESGMIGTPLA